MFSAVAADPTLSKHGRRGERRRAEGQGGMVEGRGRWSTGCLNGCFLYPFQLLFFLFFNEEFKFQARRSWPLCSSPAEKRRGGGPVAQNKRPHRLRRCRRAGAPVCWTACWPAGQTGSSTSSWPSCLGGLPGDTAPTPPPTTTTPPRLRRMSCPGSEELILATVEP